MARKVKAADDFGRLSDLFIRRGVPEGDRPHDAGAEGRQRPGLKSNHENLFEPVRAFWDGARSRGMTGGGIRHSRERSEGHRRSEARRCWATADLTSLSGREEWKDLPSVETRFYLYSGPRFSDHPLSYT